MKYLIETSRAIHYLRGRQDVVKKILSIKREELAISIITLAELYEGVFRASNSILAESLLKDFLSGLLILDINEEICKLFGRERAELHKKGSSIGDLDLLIASTCLYHDLILFTDNIKHFGIVENLRCFTSSSI